MSEAASQAVTPAEEIDVFPLFAPPEKLKVRGPKGDVTTYYVHETSGPADFWKWQVQSDQMAKEAEEGKPPSKSFYDHEVDLLVLCVKDANGNAVSRETIVGWGLALKTHAFKLAKKMNGMDREEADKLGKESETATNSGSGTK